MKRIFSYAPQISAALLMSAAIWLVLLSAGIMRHDSVRDETALGLDSSVEMFDLFTKELAARTVALSDRLSQIVARENASRSFDDLTDNPAALSGVQRAAFPPWPPP